MGTKYAGAKPIPGNTEAGYRNPHEQVQLYAGIIRAQLLLMPDQIMRIITDVFEATEWTELDKLMPVNTGSSSIIMLRKFKTREYIFPLT